MSTLSKNGSNGRPVPPRPPINFKNARRVNVTRPSQSSSTTQPFKLSSQSPRSRAQVPLDDLKVKPVPKAKQPIKGKAVLAKRPLLRKVPPDNGRPPSRQVTLPEAADASQESYTEEAGGIQLPVILPGVQSELLELRRQEESDDVRTQPLEQTAPSPPGWDQSFQALHPEPYLKTPTSTQESSEEPPTSKSSESDQSTPTVETDDGVADSFGLTDTGKDEFESARLDMNRREGLERSIRYSLDDMNQDMNNLRSKVEARVQELDFIITMHEKIMTQFKSAFRGATVKELNEMISAGWSRRGSLGFVNIEKFLKPFNENCMWHSTTTIDLRPFVPLSKISKTDDKISKTKRRRCESHLVLAPPPIPKIRPQKWGRAMLCRDSSGLNSRELSTAAHSSYSSTDSLSSESTVQEDEARKQKKILQATRATSVNVPSNVVTFERSGITTFVKLSGSMRATEDTDALEETDAKSVKSDSSISTVDKQEVDRVVNNIHTPRLFGIKLDGPIAQMLRVPLEPTKAYREKVRNTLQRYFIDFKRFAKQSRGILPLGLSAVCLTPPPSPKYPAEGLQGAESSDDVLSDILSELEDNEPDERTFEYLFNRRERNFLAKAANSGKIRGRLSEKRFPEVFTTTFKIGVPPRLPNMFCEVQTNIAVEGPPQASEGPSSTDVLSSFCGTRTCRPVEVFTEALPENQKQLVNCIPAEVTEFWQLATDAKGPLWIYRGRTVTP